MDEYIESLRKLVADSDEDYTELTELLASDLLEKGVVLDSEQDLHYLLVGGDAIASLLINFLDKADGGVLLTGMMNKMVDGYLAGFVSAYDSKDSNG